ncbi:MAG TPA: SDR family NAD(P)-dependent oxidoreductase [Thermoleophilaceae bacterium]|nr:SDR family NAD(P)-dependent oxidoreductase [Thermoleophilaceae bacterium]
MKAVVTGGAGFIGSNLVDALVERGDDVVIVDTLATGKRENVEQALARGARLVEVDIRDREALSDLFEEVRPDAVFHLAAQIDVRKSVADTPLDAMINVIGTITVLEAALRVGARVVNSSTGGAIYGEGKIMPAPEDHPAEPEAPYGQSKWAAEGYLELYRRLHRLSTISLRYGNVYGPRQDPLGEAGVIAIFCGKLVDGQTPTVFGDGKQTRDYVYVGDVVAANLAAAVSGATGPFNIGTGRETSVLDLVAALGKIAGRDFEPEFAPERPGEVQHIALDYTRAREELGYEPKVWLNEGLERTLRSISSSAQR